MATKKTSSKNSKRNNQTRKPSSQNKAKPQYRKQAASAQEVKAPLFDDRTRRDITGVVCAILAISLFATAVLSPEGMITSLVATGLRHIIGIGSYVLPFILFAISITLLVRLKREVVPMRVALGLGLLFVAFLTLVALFTPGAESNPNILFAPTFLVDRAGYIGAGIAWALLNLFGLLVSVILVIGLIVLAFIVIGFSLSNFLNVHARKSDEEETREDEQDVPPFARVRKGRDVQSVSTPKSRSKVLRSNAKTQVIPELDDQKQAQKANAAARQKTLVLPEVNDVADKQITRKLGKKNRANHDSENTKPKAARKTSVPASSSPLPSEGFVLPSMDLLKTSKRTAQTKEKEEVLQQTAQRLQNTLHDFGVDALVVDWVPGPTVTLFKVDLPAGVRVSRVSNLQDDIALALAAPGVRIFAPVPGTNYVGIEVPNQNRQTVLLGDVLKDAPEGPLQIAIGKDVEGRNIISNLATMPHLLIGGTTGSGKSVAINAMIMSILMRATPSEVRFIMIDPKRVEFTPYNGIPHLYVPVVIEAREAASALAWAVAEMERRLKIFSQVGARNIGQYNAKMHSENSDNNNEDDGSQQAHDMPYIVIVIDELADLMMNVGKEVEFSISRLAQLARAAGIHLIVATQRPSTNVVTGLIKANITNRMAFNVASGIDSRVILDTPGAENLIGLGDLLLSKPELAKPQRIQGCFVSEDEIASVVEKLKEQGEPDYHNDILKTNLITLGDSSPDGSGGAPRVSDDPLLWEAADIVVSAGTASTSNLQRRLSVGYSRAGRIMDSLESKGIVGPPNGSKPREVLVDPLELESLKAFELNDD